MGAYTPVRFDIPTGLDETGLMLGLNRLPDEDLATYRRRLLLETTERSGPTEHEFIRSIGRKVGQFDEPVFEVDVIRDANGDPLAPDPYIEVTSTHIRAYSDWTNLTLDIELNLVSRTDAYFLREVYTALNASAFFDVTIVDVDYEFKRSDRLRFDNTERFMRVEYFLESSSNNLKHDLVRAIYPEATDHFIEEVATLLLVDAVGKYYVDYLNGVIFTYEYVSGMLSYSYKEFPYRLFWQPVRPWPYKDSDKDYRMKDLMVADGTGVEEPLLLNSEGARIANVVLGVHPLGWGG